MAAVMVADSSEVGADESTAQRGGRAKYALLAAADGGTAVLLAWPACSRGGGELLLSAQTV